MARALPPILRALPPSRSSTLGLLNLTISVLVGRDLRVLKESLCHVTIIFAPPPRYRLFQSGI